MVLKTDLLECPVDDVPDIAVVGGRRVLVAAEGRAYVIS